MSESITNETVVKPKKRKGGWNPPSPAIERIQKMTNDLLGVMEGVLQDVSIPTDEKFDRLFGARGLMANLPKLVQILEELKSIPTEQAEDDAINDEDMELLRAWLQQQGA